MTRLYNILKSRITVFTNKAPYVKKRRDICKHCPYNSKYKKSKNLKDLILTLGNTFTRYCTVCGCGIMFKTSIAEAECGLADIGKEPKWKEEND